MIAENDLKHLLSEVGPRHFIFSECAPDSKTFASAILVGLCLSLDLSDHRWVK